MNEPDLNDNKPAWLNELQQKSWEPEILLSGIVLYGMFQAPALIDQFTSFVNLNIYGNTNDLSNLGALLKIALYWLTFGLILHLVSRGIWVGMVGLSFAFPNGINKKQLKYTDKYRKVIDDLPPMEQIIMNLEKVCSSLFSISFMLFMVIIGGYVYFLITLLIPIIGYLFMVGFSNVSDTETLILTIYAYIVIGIGFVGLFDFITLGLLKKIRWVNKVYYPVYRVVSALTLAKFYRPIYYALISNFNRWKLGAFLLVFILGSLFMLDKVSDSSAIPGESITRLEMWSTARSVGAFSGYYDDQNDDFQSVQAQIQSDIISENTLRLFVVLKIGIEDSIKKYCQYDTLILKQKEFEAKQQCVSEFYKVILDDEPIEGLSWRFFYNQKTQQRGIISYVDITNLPQGNHVVNIRSPSDMMDLSFAEIPFYREISQDGYSAIKKEDPKEDPSYLQLKPILPK
ncbi:MAG: hypothetical protein JXR10_14135 [Cyclobacteriaceae bacterium]